MITFRVKIVTAAALAGAGLIGCAQPATEAPAPAATQEAPALPTGEGGPGGEAGAVAAYDGLGADARAALRREQLRGFFLIAEAVLKTGAADDAGILAAQGLLEVFDPGAADFQGLNRAPLDAFAATPNPANLKAALAAIPPAPVEVETVRRLLALTRGLYAHVVDNEGGVDPIEYQHSLGAALAARESLARARIADSARKAAATAEIDRLVALWPAPVAPTAATPVKDVAAQIARVELALSGL